jgi:hypothetical protein
MSEIAVQASFNSGEWAPTLFARVDQAKYKSGAAVLENFYVDYRGGASSRAGSQYVIQAYKPSTAIRVITFQVAFNVGYVIEIGNGYMRFIYNGSLILNTALAISAATKATPCEITVVGHTFVANDWIYVTGVLGMTQLNGKFYNVQSVSGNLVRLGTTLGVNVNSTGYSTYTSGGTAAKVYTLASPYTSSDDLRLIKFTQNIDTMILCHPSYAPYVLTLVASNNWTLVPMVIGATIAAPTGVAVSSTLLSGASYKVNYSYVVTAIDTNGQESSASTPAALGPNQDIRTVAGSNAIIWTQVAGAIAYNIYEATVSYFGPVPYGVNYGFIGTAKGNTFIDSNIAADFSQSPPIPRNPFVGGAVDIITVGTAGTYTTVPTVTFSAAPSITATGYAVLSAVGTPTISGGGINAVVGDIVSFPNGLSVRVTTVGGGGVVTGITVVNAGSITTGSTPANPLAQTGTSGVGATLSLTVTYGVSAVIPLIRGAGYTSAPTITFSAGAAAATATITGIGNGQPTVPSFFQQRLVLAAPPRAPQSFYMSKPGAFYNYDISFPVASDDSISGTLVSNVLNTIKSIVSSTAGMLVLTDKASWLINGGTSGAAVTPSAIVANAQSYSGANDVPPIVANYDILYVQNKGGGVRDLAFNIYYSVFTGTDISILSSHLFFGYEILEWGWAEHPFYLAWAVRNDGVMLSLTFLKEQEFTGWAHHVTDGLYESVTVVTEDSAIIGNTDTVYNVVKRNINGSDVRYIERFADRIFPSGVSDAWCVDCGLKYTGAATPTFTGADHLAGETVTGLADGVIITPFVMPADGNFTLPIAAAKVIIGLPFTCKLQTLALDLGEPTVQGKVKKIPNVDVRVADTLGLDIGNDFNHMVPMKDLVRGNVSSMLTGQQTQVVTGLVTGDARTFLDPTYTVPGQYCIRQANPYPASILGVFPSFAIGDTK